MIINKMCNKNDQFYLLLQNWGKIKRFETLAKTGRNMGRLRSL